MKILYIGDIFGNAGINAVQFYLEKIKKENNIDLVIANAENTTNCRGLNKQDYETLKKAGINYFTMGNHTWRQNDWMQVINQRDIIRPLNVEDEQKQHVGAGTRTILFDAKTIRITNLIGSSLKSNFLTFSNPFNAMQAILDQDEKVDIDIVDFHAETTSEKNCFLQAFKNKVTIIVGTHTHVQTNDAKILDHTAYITDIGMTGPYESVIGADPESLIEMFKGNKEFFKLSEAKTSSFQFSAVIIDIDDKTNQPTSIKNIFLVNQ